MPRQPARVSAASRETFNAESYEQARQRSGQVIKRLTEPCPKGAELLAGAEEELLAFYRLPQAHWSKLRSTNPLERVSREMARRSDVVGIFPKDAAAIRRSQTSVVPASWRFQDGRRLKGKWMAGACQKSACNKPPPSPNPAARRRDSGARRAPARPERWRRTPTR
jgi:transposase-like protein